ncbi:hypothetical protein XH94_23115 [Bradyrhizobium zhanjiangense]|uniref:Uncharacterized protein n=1 Tax=Bradyrhizobium zhanjiangense TaxID=1325107 RepID=A0A4Q0SFE2_9BRAD|nr:hypothetical protein XH94_23115 [Bradyrhizobium zhanjiangense]
MKSAKCAIVQRDATCDSSALEQLTKTFLNFKYKKHEPQFRHAAWLIAASIITDVLMMLGRARRTFNPAKCVGAPWLGVPFPLQCSSQQLSGSAYSECEPARHLTCDTI